MPLPPLPPLQPFTDERVRQQIQQTFASFSLPPKKDRLISGILAIGIFDLFFLLLSHVGEAKLSNFWSWWSALSLLALTLIWNIIGALFWKPPAPTELQPTISESVLRRLHHAEAWASLWFGGELLLLSSLGMAGSLLAWNAFIQWGQLNLVPLGLYGLLYPILFWQRRWLLRIGVAFQFSWLAVLGPVSLLITLMSITAPLTRNVSVDFHFWVLNGVGAMFYIFACIAVGAALRLFSVARIHFQAYKKLLHNL